MTFNNKLMIALEGISNDRLVGYHATSSFALVKGIFSDGFVDHLESGYLCFCLKLDDLLYEWADYGPFIIEFSAPTKNMNLAPPYHRLATDEHILNNNGYMCVPNDVGYLDNFECKIKPELAKPERYGIHSRKHGNVIWFDSDPSSLTIDMINKKQFADDEFEFIAAELRLTDSRRVAIINAIRKESMYLSFTDDLAEHVPAIVTMINDGLDIVDVYDRSGLRLAQFKAIIKRLIRSGKISSDWIGADKYLRSSY